MAKKSKSSSGTIHAIHKGLTSHAPSVNDGSRKISSSKSVNDEAIRSGVAVGDSERGKDGGVLK